MKNKKSAGSCKKNYKIIMDSQYEQRWSLYRLHKPYAMTFLALLAGMSPVMDAAAAGVTTLDEVEVKAGNTGLLGTATTANQGTVLKQQLDRRTVYRPGELLETVPGLIVTQHSGEGKANQYFARGFNLDHGTDLRISVDGMLVNQRSHGHGQGWADTNFLIPELASGLQYQKGPYYADQGDFSSAGSLNIGYVNKLPQGIATIGAGNQGYLRGLIANSHEVGAGTILYAGELQKKDGPWDKKEHFGKFNAVLRYSQDTGPTRFNVTGMAYGGHWDATDQIPLRAVNNGLIPYKGNIDPTGGGESHRYSLSGALQHQSDYGLTKVNLYTLHSNLALFSNFTYFLRDEVNGDQFSQIDKRFQTGLNASHAWVNTIGRFAVENTVGVQFQNDFIDNGLMYTKARQTLSTVRKDSIVQNSIGLYYQNSIQWLEKFRTVTGVRSDFYWFDVNSDNSVNSGRRYDSMTNPKVSAILGPFYESEFYFSYGSGFHSNDARGTTTTVDPGTGLPVNRVNPLVRSTGYEAGIRTGIIPGMQASLSLFRLNLDSELLFVGDAGTTVASRPSRRDGIEASIFYMPFKWLTIDLDYAIAKSRFRDDATEGNHIPNSLQGVGSASVAFDNLGPFFGSSQFRYFGKRNLLEDGSERSGNTMTWNGQVGYKVNKQFRVIAQVFNIINTRADAITYFYESRLPNEPSGQATADKHFHPIESRSFRINMVYNF